MIPENAQNKPPAHDGPGAFCRCGLYSSAFAASTLRATSGLSVIRA